MSCVCVCVCACVDVYRWRLLVGAVVATVGRPENMAVPTRVRPELQEQTLVVQSPQVRVRRTAAVQLQELHAHVQAQTPSENAHDELRQRAARVRLPVLRQDVPAESPPQDPHGMRTQNDNVISRPVRLFKQIKNIFLCYRYVMCVLIYTKYPARLLGARTREDFSAD